MLISATNSNTNITGHTRFNKPNKPHQINTLTNQQSSPNFKGIGTVGGFLSYFIADVAGIIVGVGKIDSHFKKAHLKDVQDFGLRVIKRNHNKELENIENSTRNVVLGLQAFSQDKTSKKLAQNIKKSYEKSFVTELFIDKKQSLPKKDLNLVARNLSSLQDTVDELFVKMDNQDRYTAIAKPFLNTLSKAQEKILA